MTKDQIKYMVDRFLMWKLPESFNPDGGISFKKTFNDHLSPPSEHEPVGTNLLDFTQATEMVRHMIDGMPTDETTFAWLIEAPGPRYLATRKITTSHEFVWHSDADFAIRFSTQVQADMVMMAVRQLSPDLFGFERALGGAKPVEHGWIDVGRPVPHHGSGGGSV